MSRYIRAAVLQIIHSRTKYLSGYFNYGIYLWWFGYLEKIQAALVALSRDITLLHKLRKIPMTMKRFLC
ncbi:MAG TPA: hypothetical protein DCS13_00290 [Candidatus Margulisbacteria bacterium]|nr:MAG: hypothetical protein A2X43_10065 [Candidatus Margulisbacteria bacterium GWD2_39_127]OGI03089.1 MAG: hypothetical protein A2X42_00440 [Candidatus Margulisbacteria bacterium GWF2_38_17]HAR61882.1 hypothetical protein [Candidatus Margulisiibacteriota bacterium]